MDQLCILIILGIDLLSESDSGPLGELSPYTSRIYIYKGNDRVEDFLTNVIALHSYSFRLHAVRRTRSVVCGTGTVGSSRVASGWK